MQESRVDSFDAWESLDWTLSTSCLSYTSPQQAEEFELLCKKRKKKRGKKKELCVYGLDICR